MSHLFTFPWILLAEIIMMEQNVAIYRMSNETRFFVIGSALVSFHQIRYQR